MNRQEQFNCAMALGQIEYVIKELGKVHNQIAYAAALVDRLSEAAARIKEAAGYPDISTVS